MGELQLGGEVHPVCYLAEGVGNRGRACRGHGGRSYYSGQTASLSCGLPQCSRGLILSSPVRPPSEGRPPLLDPLLPAPLIQISDARSHAQLALHLISCHGCTDRQAWRSSYHHLLPGALRCLAFRPSLRFGGAVWRGGPVWVFNAGLALLPPWLHRRYGQHCW